MPPGAGGWGLRGPNHEDLGGGVKKPMPARKAEGWILKKQNQQASVAAGDSGNLDFF